MVAINEEPFCAAVDAVDDCAMFLLDERGRVVSWNRGAERIEGWRAEEIVGQPSAVLYPPEDVANGKPEAILHEAIAETRAHHEGWRVRKDGGRFYAEVTVTPLRDQSGIYGFLEITRDATVRWKTEQRRRFFDEFTRALSVSIADEGALANAALIAARWFADVCVVDVFDEEGRIRRIEVAHGDPRDADFARRLRTAPADRPLFPGAHDVLRTHRGLLRTVVAPAALGFGLTGRENERFAKCSAIVAPLTAGGCASGVIALLATRSGLSYDADDLGLIEELASRAGRLVENVRLYAAAQSAIRTRDDVLGIVAHDMRNLLSTVAVRTRLMMHGAASDPVGVATRAGLNAIMAVIDRMEHLLRDLLDVTRMQAANVAQDRSACPPDTLVNEAVDLALPSAALKCVALEARVSPQLPLVTADRGRIHQVFANLIGNAIKFTSRGGRIEVSAVREGGAVAFLVADTGIGIESSDLPRVFDRFWQSRGADRSGVGLGLAICKWIVEAHGGTISVSSKVGQGTTFRFTLPVA